MRKFRCTETGAVLIVTNEFTVKQFIKSNKYKEVKEEVKETTKKSIKDYNKKELIEYLKTLDIEASEDMKKNDLLALIPEE